MNLQMAASKELFEIAINKLKLRRQKAVSDYENRRNEIYQKLPRLAEIERALNATGVSVIREMLSGGCNVKEGIEHIKSFNLNLQTERQTILSKNKYPADYLSVQYYCKSCMDEGYIDGYMCSCLKKLIQDEACKKLNSRSPLKLSSFDNFNIDLYPALDDITGINAKRRMQEIFDICYNYAKEFDMNSANLMMSGPTGLGKTHLSLAIAAMVIEKGFSVVFDTAQNLFNMLENEKFNRYDTKNSNATDTLINCDLLIMDDLGTEFITPFTKAALYNIVNTRILSGYPTIISTNRKMKDMVEIYPESIISRFISNYSRLAFFGRDVRQIKARLNK
jgi:DNA replication protein DnaC